MKLLLAIGHQGAEEKLKSRLLKMKNPDEYQVLKIAIYKEQILKILQETPAIDTILVRENLAGSMDILDLIFEIRQKYSNVRLIVMTGPREIGDPVLSEMVNYGVHDIIIGNSATTKLMIDYMINPRSFADVSKYQIKRNSKIQYESKPTQQSNIKPIDKNDGIINEIEQEEIEFEVDIGTEEPNLSKPEPPVVRQLPKVKTIHEAMIGKSEEPAQNVGEVGDLEFELEMDEVELNQKEEKVPIKPNPLKQIPISIPNFKTKVTEKQEPEQSTAQKNQPKILSRKDVDSIKKTPLKGRAIKTEIKTSPIIMSIVGAKGGVGTTQVAFNLAINLASHRNKVLYIELNDHSIPFTYLYQLGIISNGLEDALNSISLDEMIDLKQYVRHMGDLKRNPPEKELQHLYDKYPDSLDFISFSQLGINSESFSYTPDTLQQLITTLLLQEGYQYIILDVNRHSNQKLITQAIKASKYVFSVMTQDMLAVAQSVDYFSKMHKKLIPLNNKLYFIINRYNSDCFSEKAILRWANNEVPFKVMDAWIVPEIHKEMNKANDNALPALLHSPPKEFLNAFETMHNYLKMM